jgi:hypothetical protein
MSRNNLNDMASAEILGHSSQQQTMTTLDLSGNSFEALRALLILQRARQQLDANESILQTVAWEMALFPFLKVSALGTQLLQKLALKRNSITSMVLASRPTRAAASRISSSIEPYWKRGSKSPS